MKTTNANSTRSEKTDATSSLILEECRKYSRSGTARARVLLIDLTNRAHRFLKVTYDCLSSWNKPGHSLDTAHSRQPNVLSETPLLPSSSLHKRERSLRLKNRTADCISGWRQYLLRWVEKGCRATMPAPKRFVIELLSMRPRTTKSALSCTFDI